MKAEEMTNEQLANCFIAVLDTCEDGLQLRAELLRRLSASSPRLGHMLDHGVCIYCGESKLDDREWMLGECPKAPLTGFPVEQGPSPCCPKCGAAMPVEEVWFLSDPRRIEVRCINGHTTEMPCYPLLADFAQFFPVASRREAGPPVIPAQECPCSCEHPNGEPCFYCVNEHARILQQSATPAPSGEGIGSGTV